ncbi:MAG: hypothetical protein ABIP37_02825, partial [Methylotenera sp.]
MKKIAIFSLVILMMSALSSCANKKLKPDVPAAPAASKQKCDCAANVKNAESNASKPTNKISPQIPEPKTADLKAELKIADYGLLKPAQWDDVDGLTSSNPGSNANLNSLSFAWPAWMLSCTTLVNKPMWKSACNAAALL